MKLDWDRSRPWGLIYNDYRRLSNFYWRSMENGWNLYWNQIANLEGIIRDELHTISRNTP